MESLLVISLVEDEGYSLGNEDGSLIDEIELDGEFSTLIICGCSQSDIFLFSPAFFLLTDFSDGKTSAELIRAQKWFGQVYVFTLSVVVRIRLMVDVASLLNFLVNNGNNFVFDLGE